MKKSVLIQQFLILLITRCIGQINTLSSNHVNEQTPKTCQIAIENKQIEYCYMNLDTLTFSQLKECKKLTILDNLRRVDSSTLIRITSYLLRYMHADGTTMTEHRATDDRISNEMISWIIESGTKKILFEEIIGIDGEKNLDLGYRWFYLK